ncbi:MAG TPA: molybdopterin molybdotransferase MoeA, partial [Eudoraea sp.]|nr:molybdopterin molybdotransferase MoeA [Eudoraea sp.]
QSRDYGEEWVPIRDATGRILAEDIHADRDFPPFNRSTKDGIAIHYSAIEQGQTDFQVAGVLAAGAPPRVLGSATSCIEIMTGAVVPEDANTVVMYEDVVIEGGIAHVKKPPLKSANIHFQGSDEKMGALLLQRNSLITPAAIGVMASVGKSLLRVKQLPGISIISTGRELVQIDTSPLPHQIRRSNAYALFSALSKEGIIPLLLHLDDDKDIIRQKLAYAIQEMDVLLLSGGVSRGKFDFIPEILSELGVDMIFHKVKQRPGKPFWFGIHHAAKTVIFSFPGNPASTFANYHIYFKPWLLKSLGMPVPENHVILGENLSIQGELTRFIRARIQWSSGTITATTVHGNGSGDLTSLARSDGFIQLDPERQNFKKGELVPFIATNNIV